MIKVKVVKKYFKKVSRGSDKQSIMYFITIISLLVSVPQAECLIQKTLETRELHIALTTDGQLLNPSKIPSCSNGEKILLKTYEYEYAECDYIDECVFSNKERLLAREILRLHEMCSFQNICRNLSFLSRTNQQKSRTNAVHIKYQCIDPRTNIVDICKTQAIAFSDTFYLTINTMEVSRNKYCQCTIQSGSFALSLHDVRLKVSGKDNCSSARLHINRREFSCKPDRVDFGSKFGIMFNPRMANAYIGFSYSPTYDKPEMMMLIGKPNEMVSVFCGSSSSEPQVDADSQNRKRTLINQISTTSDSQDLASEKSSDWPGTKSTTVETTEILANYTPISSDTDCFLELYKLNNTCVISCPDHYYEYTETVKVLINTARPVSQKRGICFECNEVCQTCDGPMASDCLKCSDEFEMRHGVCQRKGGIENTNTLQNVFIGIVCSLAIIIVLVVLLYKYKIKPSGFPNELGSIRDEKDTDHSSGDYLLKKNNSNDNGRGNSR